MNKQKCGHCQLVNLASDLECRRCGRILGMKNPAPTVAHEKKGFSIFPIAVAVFVLGIGGFIFWGVQRSFYDAAAEDAKRTAGQRGTQAFQAGPAVTGEPPPGVMAGLQNVNVKPITVPSIDMSKYKYPVAIPPNVGAAAPPPAPPPANPNTAKVQAIQNGLPAKP
jgi:hypothetical protein